MGKGEKMRLIDADNLKIPSDAPYKASVKRVVAQQPTVEAVLVVHGEWKTDCGVLFPVYRCSECNCATALGKTKFCPNCGADMRISAE